MSDFESIIHEVSWQSPSNIALVKYWGKHGVQLPSNPSISFTLNSCRTKTKLISRKNDLSVRSIDVYVDDQLKSDFKPKVEKLFDHAERRFPFLSSYSFEIRTNNTFPHSSGIASSASGMSALALCICSFALAQEALEESDFWKSASELARLGSGSACRSLFSGLSVWGEHTSIQGSSDKYGIQYDDVHPDFLKYQDTILLIHKGQKSVSSTVGHKLLEGHPFAEIRFSEARNNMDLLLDCLRKGDKFEFAEIVEKEALMLHALMMTSDPYFILMQPETLAAIKKIREFRKQNNIPVAFTLDAGANVHVLYPEDTKEKVLKFVQDELASFCEDGTYLCDSVGFGPTKEKC